MALGSDMIDLLFAPHHRGQLRANILKLVNGPEDYIGNLIEVDALHADGREIPVEMSLGVARTANGPIAIAFLRDITQRRRSNSPCSRHLKMHVGRNSPSPVSLPS